MQMIKKIWVLAGMVFTMLVAGGWHFFWEAEVNGPMPQYIFQTITADSCQARTITWQTEAVDGKQQLKYCVQGSDAIYIKEVTGVPLATGEAAAMLLYSVTLTDLMPDTIYQYQVGSKNNWSEWHTFKTAAVNMDEFKAIIFGDSQSIDYSLWAQTAQSAWQRNLDAAFFINMGDLVDIGSHYPQWQAWFAGGTAMMADIPAAVISGNHENYLPGGTYTPANLYLQLFNLPENGPDQLNRQAYSFDYGNVHFTALDSQYEELAAFQPSLISQQLNWLEQDLAQAKQPWKIVIIHRSLFENTKTGALNELGKAFVPLFDKYKVAVVFMAHIHTYGRTPPLIAGRLAQQGETGTVYLSTGRSGDITGEDSVKKDFDQCFKDCLSQPNYLILEADKSALRITNFEQDGSLADRVVINH